MNRSKHGGGSSMSVEDEISLESFSAADRERVMELLLSQERVINLLYDKTFPRKSGDSKGMSSGNLPPLEQAEGHDLAALDEEYDAALEDISEM